MFDWVKRARHVPWWTSSRPLRLATDCSGLAVPEIALAMLGDHCGASVHHVFACDIWTGSQQWLQAIGVSPILKDMNSRIWKPVEGRILTRNLAGQVVSIHRDEAALDLYICGFMCTPFTPNGQRRAWADEHSKTFWSAVKTISVLRPRVAILENVRAISNNANHEIVVQALSKLRGYIICYLKMNSTEHGIPHHRARVYMVAFRVDALNPAFAKRSPTIMEQYLRANLKKFHVTCPNDFYEFLDVCGFPLTPWIQEGPAADEGCTCSFSTPCDLHQCRCTHGKGNDHTLCKWRATCKSHCRHPNFKAKRYAYLKKWRMVKKDKTLKSPPDYFQLAKSKALATEVITQPSRRVVLRCLSQCQNLMQKHCILNVGKSVSRTSIRSDGMVPCLGHGCLTLFVPSQARFLDIPQLLCLTGFHPKLNADVFKQAEDMRATDMDLLLGNAMCLPLVGTLAACALAMLQD